MWISSSLLASSRVAVVRQVDRKSSGTPFVDDGVLYFQLSHRRQHPVRAIGNLDTNRDRIPDTTTIAGQHGHHAAGGLRSDGRFRRTWQSGDFQPESR